MKYRGRTFVGGYRIVGEIGRGGGGTVYRAEDRDGQEVALKIVRSENRRQQGRFRREVESLVRLRHPGLVPIRDAGEDDGVCYMVLDLIESSSLQDQLDRAGPFTPPEAARIVAGVADAVAHAHGQGVLHRDLAPKNVLLDGEDPKVTDFGLAKDLEASYSSLSKTGVFVGTPGFWAPEQARGAVRDYGVHTDVYGLGGVLYALLTGEPPYSGGSIVELMLAHEQPPVAPRSLRAEVPKALEKICLRCLKIEPADRYPDAAAVAAALRGFLNSTRRARSSSVLVPTVLGIGLGAVVLGVAARLLAPPAPETPPSKGSNLPAKAERPPTSADPGIQHLADARRHLIAGRFAEAVRAVSGVPGVDGVGEQANGKQVVDALCLRAEARIRAAGWNREEAETDVLADLDAALALRPEHPDALALRGYARLRPTLDTWIAPPKSPQVTEEVSAQARNAIRADPSHPLANLVLEVCVPNSGKTLGARRREDGRFEAEALLLVGLNATDPPALRRSITLLPDPPEGYDRMKAHGLALLGFFSRILDPPDLVAARLHLDEAIQLRPNTAPYYYHRSGLFHDVNDTLREREDLARAIEIGPPIPEYYVNWTELMIRQEAGQEEILACSRRLLDAMELRSKGVGRISPAKILYWGARCDMILGRPRARILSILQTADQRWPGDPQVQQLLAELSGG